MNWKWHIIISLFVSVTTFLVINYYFNIIGNRAILWYIPFLCFYAILPDIDIGTSIIRRIFNIVAAIFTLVCLGLYFYMESISFVYFIIAIIIITLIVNLTMHRGIFHTILMGFVLAIPMTYFGYLWALLCVIAYSTHLFMDGEFRLF